MRPTRRKIIRIGADMDAKYFAEAKKLSIDPAAIQRQHDLNIVYTPIHGSGITLVPGLLREFGFTNVSVVQAQATPDGNFPTVQSPNPEEKSAMQLALDQAKATNADIVLATDPDADRVGVGVKNDQGEWVLLNGNQTAAMLTNYLLSARHRAGQSTPQDFIVYTIVTSEILGDIAREHQREKLPDAHRLQVHRRPHPRPARARKPTSAAARKATASSSAISCATRMPSRPARWWPKWPPWPRTRAAPSTRKWWRCTPTTASTWKT